MERIIAVFVKLCSVDYSREVSMDYRAIEELSRYLYMVFELSQGMRIWVYY